MAEKPPLSPSSVSLGIVKEKIQKLGLTDVNEGNVVPIDPEKFTPDQKKDFDAMMQQARDQFLNSFMQTRKGTLVQKYKVKVVADDTGTSSSKAAADSIDTPDSTDCTTNSAAGCATSSANATKAAASAADSADTVKTANRSADSAPRLNERIGRGDNLNYQYQPPSPQAQYQPGGLAQPQFASQYSLFEPMQQHSQAAVQQRPWADVIADVMREQFGLKPKETISLYRQPYPECFERVPLPNRFKVPDFSKFSGQDGVSTYEHISRLLAQCCKASVVDALRVRLFRLSLSGSALSWFSSLPYGSINSWADLEKQFHSYFYSGVHEMKLSDLTVIKQRHDEPMHEYIQRFREMRNKCFSLSLTDAQLANLAFQGMIAPIREKFSSKDFDSLSYLIQKVTLHEHRSVEARKCSKKVNHVCPYIYGSDDDEDDSEIATAEWVRSKNVISCQWVKRSGKEERYDFDINKADKIFDLLLREKQIQLPAGHIIPSAEELGKKRYCKWHNSGSHMTNDCKVFRRQIQAAIEGGKIKFDDSKRPMKVDGNPFPVNMVHTAGRTADGGRVRGFRMNSAKIINKYQRKYNKQ
uniref:Retrotransposon protein, putative, unclassified n=3 Tax=Oryza sativa subsp. japonica TaxID=39947 RepID=Q2R6L5_ORYSJ|nr:retrotransposon protein, putative, unclassified [Oryza sativa Japonica Group]ABA92938.1 retrotransposon protein, putative, unclassified [Oryza sativa Japonica Group]